MNEDIRWQQRLTNFLKALNQLREDVALSKTKELSNTEERGLIKAFEFTYELAWNLLRDYLLFQGHTGIAGSRDAIREAFNKALIANGHVWMEMIKSRNQSSHTYDEVTADKVARDVITLFAPEFERLATTFLDIQDKENA